jgi:predicted nucleic acid-binding protein
MMDREAVFVDTWGWMALGHRREPRHAEVKRIYQELRSNQIPIYTSDYVLDEVITLLFRHKPTISFTDLTSMAIMDERGIQQVLTGDEHFIQVGMGFSRVP